MKNAIWLFICAILVLLAFLPSYTKMQDLKQKNLAYQEKIRTLVEKNNQLTEERRMLEEDPEYLEKVAREKMGLIRENEVVVKFTLPAVNTEE